MLLSLDLDLRVVLKAHRCRLSPQEPYSDQMPSLVGRYGLPSFQTLKTSHDRHDDGLVHLVHLQSFSLKDAALYHVYEEQV